MLGEDFEWVVGNAPAAASAQAQWQHDLIAAITGTESAAMQAVALEVTARATAITALAVRVTALEDA